MALATQHSKLVPSRSPRAYRLEMESRTALLVLGLLVLTGGVIFYLGVVTGMGMRDPSASVPVVTQTPPELPQQGTPTPSELTFNKALEAPPENLEALKLTESAATRQTEDLISRAQRELKLEEVPAKPAASQTPAPAQPAKPAAGQVATASQAPKPAATAGQGTVGQGTAGQGATGATELFTVQVFSSQNQKSAQELMLKLKQEGYAAYLNQYQSADKTTWYRVRVGRFSRAEADLLARRLKEDAKLASAQVLKL